MQFDNHVKNVVHMSRMFVKFANYAFFTGAILFPLCKLAISFAKHNSVKNLSILQIIGESVVLLFGGIVIFYLFYIIIRTLIVLIEEPLLLLMEIDNPKKFEGLRNNHK